ncbi:MAG: M28 family peptidase [Clostridiales bacterium]|nr:M28 family peptidase [Clostridiales bacterium]
MYKKFIVILLVLMLALGLGSCGRADYGEEFTGFDESIDMDFAKEVIENIGSFGDDPVMGMRSAGSPAEGETVKYLEGVMKDIGLQNITVDEATVDGWTFNGANVTFTNAKGKEQKIDLASYQTTLQADNETCQLVYLKEGTEGDYEGVDVTDKLVLIDVDQNENWWISYPTVQAKLKGAKAVVAVSLYPEDGADRVGVQDVCAPADAPALAISEKDSKALRKAIKAGGGDSVSVVLNCDSTVTEDATTHNLWGEIPGETPETVFVFAHMDGYFHSQYDDAQGVGVSMAIAKALIDSDYKPEKTIRFCMHGSEEWGVSGSEYDWSAGAYEEIMTTHPEWVNGAFAIVNNDGGYSVEGETYMGTRSAIELKSFIKESIGQLNEESKYEWSYRNTSTYTEDFQWARMGIPAIVAGEGDGEKYDNMGYHSTYDSFDAQPLDEDGFREVIQTYGKLVIDLDNTLVRPMNFTVRLKSFEKSLSDKSEFKDLLDKGYEASAALEEKMAAVEESGDKDVAVELNVKTQAVYKSFQDSLVGLNFDPEVVIKHELYQSNLEAIDGTIKALEDGDVQTAYDEYLWAIDWAWYYMYFDESTVKTLENQLFDNREGTWGEGLIQYRHADIGGVVKSLQDKYDVKKPDVSAEIAKLKELREQQQSYYDAMLASEKVGLESTISLMEEYAK